MIQKTIIFDQSFLNSRPDESQQNEIQSQIVQSLNQQTVLTIPTI